MEPVDGYDSTDLLLKVLINMFEAASTSGAGG
eukprot:SAG11_NODE_1563_length_4675_cov_10.530376_4_plen_32_part_00